MSFKYIALLIGLLISLTSNAQVVSKSNFTDTSFKVFGACEQCKSRIEEALKIKGIPNRLVICRNLCAV